MRKNRTVQAALTAIVVVGIALFAAAPASAGAKCGTTGCSSTYNDSSTWVTAYFNWCMGLGTGDYTTQEPTCSSDNVAQRTDVIYPGEHTVLNQDWDAFKVDAGWCYRVDFKLGPLTDFTHTYDQRGGPSVYVKVGDPYDAHIKAQSSTSCP